MVSDRKLTNFGDSHAGVFIAFQTLGCLVFRDLSWLEALPMRTVGRCLGSGKSRAIIGPAVCQPATGGLQDVEMLWGESLRV